MKKLIEIIYSYLIFPAIFSGAHIAGLFSKRIRTALCQRYRIFAQIRQQFKGQNKKTIIIHSASMGEYEHIRPLIYKLALTGNYNLVLTFFSPSGYNHVHPSDRACLVLYIPFDFRFLWKKFYALLNPRLLIISKHDVWPNQLWMANRLGIPVHLINASLNEQSSRTRWYARAFLKYVYKAIDAIHTISEEDTKRFNQFFSGSRATTLGDTKFDQVVIRKEQSRAQKIIPDRWLDQKTVCLFGSVWPEDTRHLLPAMKEILTRKKDVRFIVVPHQPGEKYLREIEETAGPSSVVTYSRLEDLKDQPVLVIDTIGILADLYKYAHIAYVGGSFKQGIHNVMEAAVYGLPVLFGPVHRNSYDAIKMLEQGGAFLVRDQQDARDILMRLLDDGRLRTDIGQITRRLAYEQTGASDRLVKIWQKDVL